jgi:hypothetical protein
MARWFPLCRPREYDRWSIEFSSAKGIDQDVLLKAGFEAGLSTGPLDTTEGPLYPAGWTEHHQLCQGIGRGREEGREQKEIDV